MTSLMITIIPLPFSLPLFLILLLIAGCMHHTPGWDDVPPRLLLIGGLLGGFTRAYAGQTVRKGARWWESFVNIARQRWTLWHIFSGGAAALLFPMTFQWYYRVELIGSPLSPWFFIGTGFLIGGFANYILVAVLWRVGVFKDDPRARTPENGPEKEEYQS